ncbi:ribosomal RNA small subunit methyltransferase A [Candidatus Saccharibacteria bacterium]|nr:ribosomal RNA small subunit methyltransferase A [Candidatus Saccharibacteria bacterium]
MSTDKTAGPLPNKSLGQHWLFDKASLHHIVGFAGVEAGDTVLEIGPGKGPLTRLLLEKGAAVTAVEFDAALAIELARTITLPGFTVHHADILRYDLSVMPLGYKVVANVPYYITSKIVRLLLESNRPPASATLLVQKEVAERLAAGPGEMSLLSVSAQFYATVTLGDVVPKELFEPAPKVDSRVVRLDYTGPKYDDVDRRFFFRVVKAGFAERRKKLRSSLAGGLQLEKSRLDGILAEAGIPAEARAQELTLQQWHRLASLLPMAM